MPGAATSVLVEVGRYLWSELVCLTCRGTGQVRRFAEGQTP
jgi:hypothetical protein